MIRPAPAKAKEKVETAQRGGDLRDCEKTAKIREKEGGSDRVDSLVCGLDSTVYQRLRRMEFPPGFGRHRGSQYADKCQRRAGLMLYLRIDFVKLGRDSLGCYSGPFPTET